jgi:hypothetical protein
LNEDDLTGDAWIPEKAHFVATPDGLRAEASPPRTQSGAARALWTARQRSALLNHAIIRLQSFVEATRNAPPLFFASAAARPSTDQRATVSDTRIVAELAATRGAYDGHVTFLFLSPFDPKAPDVPSRVEGVFTDACRANGWSCVALRSGYAAFAARHAAPYGFPNSGFNVGHMNPEGHRLAADLLAGELRRLRADALL